MNDLALYSLLLFIIIRTIGLAISIDYYYSTKKIIYVYFSIGWFFLIVAALCPIISEFSYDVVLSELFLVMNGTSASLAIAFIAMGTLLTFVKIPFKAFFSLIIALIIIPIIFLTIGYFKTALNFAIISINFLYIIAFVLPIFRVKKFKEHIGKSIVWYHAVTISFFCYIPVSTFIIIQGYSYGLYNINNPLLVILNYIFPLATTVILIVFLVHLEYGISNNQKFQLKDKYSHEIGNILQIIQSSTDIISQKKYKMNVDLEEVVDLVKTKCKEASTLLREIRAL